MLKKFKAYARSLFYEKKEFATKIIENQGKSYIGQQVDRYNRNKEFGQDVRDWLKERKNQENDNHNE